MVVYGKRHEIVSRVLCGNFASLRLNLLFLTARDAKAAPRTQSIIFMPMNTDYGRAALRLFHDNSIDHLDSAVGNGGNVVVVRNHNHGQFMEGT